MMKSFAFRDLPVFIHLSSWVLFSMTDAEINIPTTSNKVPAAFNASPPICKSRKPYLVGEGVHTIGVFLNSNSAFLEAPLLMVGDYPSHH